MINWKVRIKNERFLGIANCIWENTFLLQL